MLIYRAILLCSGYRVVNFIIAVIALGNYLYAYPGIYLSSLIPSVYDRHSNATLFTYSAIASYISSYAQRQSVYYYYIYIGIQVPPNALLSRAASLLAFIWWLPPGLTTIIYSYNKLHDWLSPAITFHCYYHLYKHNTNSFVSLIPLYGKGVRNCYLKQQLILSYAYAY